MRVLFQGRGGDSTDHPASSTQPDHFILLGNRAFSILRSATPDYEAALADTEAAVRIAPNWAKGHVRRGEALEGLGRKGEAVKAYEEAIKHGAAQVKKGELHSRLSFLRHLLLMGLAH